jgi:hypothetical protein
VGKVQDSLDDGLTEWIARQPVFFVATAPAAGGHVNLSPKGLDTLRVLAPDRVAYLDLTGSGVETIAHLRDDGRITLMLCAFDGPPRILRLYGTGRVHQVGSPGFDALHDLFPDLPGARAIIEVEIGRVQTSCGYAVPRMELVDERPTLREWAERRGPDGIAAYHAERNETSIDGLPGFDAGAGVGAADAAGT